MPDLNKPTLRRALRAIWASPPAAILLAIPLLAATLLSGAPPAAAQSTGGDPAAPALAATAPATAPAPASASPTAPATAPAATPPSSARTIPTVTDSATPAAPPDTVSPTGAPSKAGPDTAAPSGKTRAVKHASHAHRRASPGTMRPEDSTDATVALTTQPGSELETTATRLVSSDLKQSRSAGDPPVMLVGSARLSVKPGPASLFVQVQSADFCGSAGCSTSAYVKDGSNWTKVLDSISGPIKVSRRSHHGMYDLLVHGQDRWVWNGRAYADTLPSPDVDLLHSVRK